MSGAAANQSAIEYTKRAALMEQVRKAIAASKETGKRKNTEKSQDPQEKKPPRTKDDYRESKKPKKTPVVTVVYATKSIPLCSPLAFGLEWSRIECYRYHTTFHNVITLELDGGDADTALGKVQLCFDRNVSLCGIDSDIRGYPSDKSVRDIEQEKNGDKELVFERSCDYVAEKEDDVADNYNKFMGCEINRAVTKLIDESKEQGEHEVYSVFPCPLLGKNMLYVTQKNTVSPKVLDISQDELPWCVDYVTMITHIPVLDGEKTEAFLKANKMQPERFKSEEFFTFKDKVFLWMYSELVKKPAVVAGVVGADVVSAASNNELSSELTRLKELNMQALVTVDRYRKERDEARVDVKKKSKEIDDARIAYASKKEELKSAKEELKSAKNELEDKKKTLDAMKFELDTATNNLTKADEKLKTRNAEKKKLEKLVEDKDKKIAELDGDIAKTGESILQLNASLKDKGKTIKELEKECNMHKENAERVAKEYSAYREENEKTIQKLRNDVLERERALVCAKDDYDELKTKYDALVAKDGDNRIRELEENVVNVKNQLEARIRELDENAASVKNQLGERIRELEEKAEEVKKKAEEEENEVNGLLEELIRTNDELRGKLAAYTGEEEGEEVEEEVEEGEEFEEGEEVRGDVAMGGNDDDKSTKSKVSSGSEYDTDTDDEDYTISNGGDEKKQLESSLNIIKEKIITCKNFGEKMTKDRYSYNGENAKLFRMMCGYCKEVYDDIKSLYKKGGPPSDEDFDYKDEFYIYYIDNVESCPSSEKFERHFARMSRWIVVLCEKLMRRVKFLLSGGKRTRKTKKNQEGGEGGAGA